MKKRWSVLITAAVMAVAMAAPAYAGAWGQDETGYWYQNDSGSYARGQILNIDGTNYGFDANAYMATGWYQQGEDWYYFDTTSGAQLTGWLQDNGAWYYLEPGSGKMHKSWLDYAGERYFLDKQSGAMKTGGFTVYSENSGECYYYAEPDGRLRRNKLEKQDDITIRYDNDGRQWYKNNETIVDGMNDGDEWQPITDPSKLAAQREEVNERNEDFIFDQMAELYFEYRDEVLDSRTYKMRESKKARWEEKVNTKLAKLYVPQAEIDQFILDVEGGILEFEE